MMEGVGMMEKRMRTNKSRSGSEKICCNKGRENNGYIGKVRRMVCEWWTDKEA